MRSVGPLFDLGGRFLKSVGRNFFRCFTFHAYHVPLIRDITMAK